MLRTDSEALPSTLPGIRKPPEQPGTHLLRPHPSSPTAQIPPLTRMQDHSGTVPVPARLAGRGHQNPLNGGNIQNWPQSSLPEASGDALSQRHPGCSLPLPSPQAGKSCHPLANWRGQVGHWEPYPGSWTCHLPASFGHSPCLSVPGPTHLVANMARSEEKVAASSLRALSSLRSFIIVSVTMAFSFSYLLFRLARATSAVWGQRHGGRWGEPGGARHLPPGAQVERDAFAPGGLGGLGCPHPQARVGEAPTPACWPSALCAVW